MSLRARPRGRGKKGDGGSPEDTIIPSEACDIDRRESKDHNIKSITMRTLCGAGQDADEDGLDSASMGLRLRPADPKNEKTAAVTSVSSWFVVFSTNPFSGSITDKTWFMRMFVRYVAGA